MIMTVDIFGSLVTEFNATLTSKILSIVDDGNDVYTIQVCDVMHVRPLSVIQIGEPTYTVISISYNYITITGVIAPPALIYTAPPLFYWHGTPKQTGNELKRIQDSNNKTPMLYLYEVLDEDLDINKGSSIDRRTDALILFLDQANYQDWDTDKHYSNVINPMANVARLFMTFLQAHKDIARSELTTVATRYHANYSLVTNIDGHETNLFGENLSGVEMRLIVPIKKSITCVATC